MTDREKKIETVVIEGVTLVKRHPVGWQTEDARYELVEIRRGLWEAHDTKASGGRAHVASGGTRVGLVQRLAKILDGSYKGSLPYTSG